MTFSNVMGAVQILEIVGHIGTVPHYIAKTVAAMVWLAIGTQRTPMIYFSHTHTH